MHKSFTLSYPTLDRVLFDTTVYREFAQLCEFAFLPDECSYLPFFPPRGKALSTGANPADLQGSIVFG